MNSEPERNVEGCENSSGLPELEGAHGLTIRRMIKDAPPFRPEAAPEELVAEFANGQNRMAAFLALYDRGPKAG